VIVGYTSVRPVVCFNEGIGAPNTVYFGAR
jgi:hypothetical protein